MHHQAENDEEFGEGRKVETPEAEAHRRSRQSCHGGFGSD